MPADRQVSRSPGMALAVIAIEPRRLVAVAALEDPARGLDAVHLGHLDVHQHHVVGLALDRIEHLQAVGGDVGAIAQALQQPQHDLLVHRVVLGHEHAQRQLLREREAERRRPALGVGGAAGAPPRRVDQHRDTAAPA